MKSQNAALMSGTTMDTNLTCDAVDLSQFDQVSWQCVWTGTPTGTLYLQYSNDPVSRPSEVTNWTDASSQATGGAAGNHMFDAQTGAKWGRIRYAFSSSTGALSIAYCGKGAH